MRTCVETEPVLAHTIRVTEDFLMIVLAGETVSIPWQECSPLLARETTAQRLAAELSPAGYGIHWPLVDEDPAVGPLVESRSQK